MSSGWHGGVPWAPSVLRRALEEGVADEVSALALRHRQDRGGYHTTPHDHPYGGLQVHDGHVTAILSTMDIVVGFRTRTPEQMEEARAETEARRAEASKNSAGVARSRGGAGNLNPTSWDELAGMLRDAGLIVEQGKTHMLVLSPRGDRISSMPVTASDHRSLNNAVAQLRRTTGLPLRRNQRGR